MSATGKSNGKRQKRSSAASGRTEPANLGLVLDQDEVMKAMMAAAGQSKSKGKGRADESDEEESEGLAGESDEGSDEAEEDEEGEMTPRPPLEDESISDSQSEAGPSSPRPASPPRAAIPSISRVNASQSAPDSRPTPTAAFSAEPKPAPSTTFESLGLSAPLISALGSINISKPTEIQSACVKAIMSGRDCIGGAKTGSGKTLAFALPIVERIARDPFGVWAVVLTPTRSALLILTGTTVLIFQRAGISIDRAISRCWKTPRIDDNNDRRRYGQYTTGERAGSETSYHCCYPWTPLRSYTE